MVISDVGGSGYDNYLPAVCLSFEWWVHMGANIHVYADISLFSSYQDGRGSSVLMGNGTHATVYGVDTVNMNFTWERSCS